MRVYICAGNMSYKEASKVSKFLEKHGHVVHFAAENRPMDIPDEHVFLNNLVQIRNTDLFIAFFMGEGKYGIDYEIHVGMASEAGKTVIGFLDMEKRHQQRFFDGLQKNVMFNSAFDMIFTDLEEFGRYLLEI